MTLRRFLLASVVLGVIVGAAVGGIRALVGNGEAEPPSPTPTVAPTPVPETETPLEVAQRFADAWEAGDVPAMYDLLDSGTRSSLTLAAFTEAYAGFRQEVGVTAIDVSVSGEDAQRVTFRVRLETSYFGTLEYATAVPFVSPEQGSPRIAWTPAVMHPALTPGRELQGEVRRPARGAIYDRNGEPLAITLDVRMIGLDRSRVFDEETVTAAFVSFGFEEEEVAVAFASPLGQRHRVPLGIVPDSQVEEAARFVEAVPGAVLWFEERRVHPLGPAAAHVVGYTREYTAEELADRPDAGLLPGDRFGAVGIEAAMNDVLAGRVGARLVVTGGDDELVVLFERAYVPGEDVHTTLDSALLRAAHEGLAGLRGAAVVLDPRTNAILALNSSPAFDPNAFELGNEAAVTAFTTSDDDPLNDRATHGLYSAGSTFKLVTGAAGLAQGAFSPEDRIFCGAIWYGIDPPRRNWEGEQGELSIAEGLMRSCNPVFYEIALTLYNEAPGVLSDMARAFGFGAESGVEGLYDDSGLVPDAAWKQAIRGEPWYPGDAVNLGIGQGDLLVTPLQLANAYSAFLNGELRTPTILAGVAPLGRGALPLESQDAAHLRAGLELVTGTRGTAGWVFADAGYDDFGGKSGTAEEAEGQAHVLFVAYSPRDVPAALAAVVFDDAEEGRPFAAPLARDLVLAALNPGGSEEETEEEESP
ncbi:MAG: penicillin-binding transpeptidase domain-containing protein [Chloroflexi bacterium]|nr:penicillin-binding transpeptidase domain-containing protein [Chloroflexota bacterium]